MFFHQPHFNFPMQRDAAAQNSQRIELTVEGARHYNELHSTDCLKAGQILGYVMRNDSGGVDVYSHNRHYMAPCESKLFAAEELLRLALRRGLADSTKVNHLKVA